MKTTAKLGIVYFRKKYLDAVKQFRSIDLALTRIPSDSRVYIFKIVAYFFSSIFYLFFIYFILFIKF